MDENFVMEKLQESENFENKLFAFLLNQTFLCET